VICFTTPRRLAAWSFRKHFGRTCECQTRLVATGRTWALAQASSALYPPFGGIRLDARVTQTRGGMRSRFLLVLLAFGVSSCDGSPSRNILGSYFPSWMVCALVGIAAAVIGRAILKATGLLGEIPAPLAMLLAIACAVTFGLWLVWLA
jgi:YtcA family